MLWTALERHRYLGLFIARIDFGGGFIWYHGWPKLTAGWERLGALAMLWGISASRSHRSGGVWLPPWRSRSAAS